jgi:hypothetical protein
VDEDLTRGFPSRVELGGVAFQVKNAQKLLQNNI